MSNNYHSELETYREALQEIYHAEEEGYLDEEEEEELNENKAFSIIRINMIGEKYLRDFLANLFRNENIKTWNISEIEIYKDVLGKKIY
jgi:hypothetical protein